MVWVILKVSFEIIILFRRGIQKYTAPRPKTTKLPFVDFCWAPNTPPPPKKKKKWLHLIFLGRQKARFFFGSAAPKAFDPLPDYDSTPKMVRISVFEGGKCLGNFWTLKFPYHPWDWYIRLIFLDFFMVNVGMYTIHGWYGIWCKSWRHCLIHQVSWILWAIRWYLFIVKANTWFDLNIIPS